MIINTKNKKGYGILRTHIMEGETNSCKLSANVHSHTEAHMCAWACNRWRKGMKGGKKGKGGRVRGSKGGGRKEVEERKGGER